MNIVPRICFSETAMKKKAKATTSPDLLFRLGTNRQEEMIGVIRNRIDVGVIISASSY